MGEIVERSALEELGRKLRGQGKKIVSTNGCFDILHVGHARILKEARELGDLLVVGLNSDGSVARLKGPQRPINSQADRAELLCALACVDYVTVFDEDTPVEFLRLLQPDIHVKGADYKPADLEETPVVEAGGGRVVILKLVPGKSTTSLVERIRTN
jgi:rfaE bifunctional protein nucleotidyltransferase chain/domain